MPQPWVWDSRGVRPTIVRMSEDDAVIGGWSIGAKSKPSNKALFLAWFLEFLQISNNLALHTRKK
jgi:hypothetical protein